MKPNQRNVAVVIGLLVLASLALAFTVDVSLVDQPGVRMTLPESVGAWTGSALRYCHSESCYELMKLNTVSNRISYLVRDLPSADAPCPTCGQPLHPMSREEYNDLPKDTQFAKSEYRRGDDTLFVSIVLSGKDRESIHRPERCLTGQGHTITRDFRVPVKLANGRTIRVRVFQAVKHYQDMSGQPHAYYSYFAYWFVGQKRETEDDYWRMFWLAWDRIVHGVAHKWAYISVSGQRTGDNQDYLPPMKDFIAQLHDEVVLP